MGFNWRDRARDLQAENEGLRRKLDHLLRMVASGGGPGEAPAELLDAIRQARWPGQAVKLQAAWRDEHGTWNEWRVAAVVGPEGADHDAIWRDIVAAAQVCTEGGTPGADYRLIPPVRMALGLRAVVVPEDGHLTAVGSSVVSAHQRATAVGKAAAAIRGHRIPAAAMVPLLLPVWWRKAAALGAAAVTATALAIPGGQAYHLWQPPPASAATQHAQAGSRDRSASPHAPESGRRGHGGSGAVAAGAAAPTRTDGAAALPAAPSPGTTTAPQPQPPPTTPPPRPSPTLPVPLPSVTVSASVPPVPLPSPHPTVKVKVCIAWVLNVCVKWKLVVP